jgi:dTDP-4-amino-4,6-dideoxy-D-glucose acyltransferase
VLSAGSKGIHIGSYVHLACGCYLFGSSDQIVLEDFTSVSSRVAIYTANDDYTGGYMTNPTVPDEYRNVNSGPVTLRKHAIVGTGSVILPGVEIGLGGSVGALSVVREDIADFLVVFGNPQKVIGKRGNQLLELEKRLRAAAEATGQ